MSVAGYDSAAETTPSHSFWSSPYHTATTSPASSTASSPKPYLTGMARPSVLRPKPLYKATPPPAVNKPRSSFDSAPPTGNLRMEPKSKGRNLFLRQQEKLSRDEEDLPGIITIFGM